MKSNKNIIPFIDVLFTYLLVFVCIIMLIKVSKSDQDSSAYQQSVVYQIIMTWEGNADMDLWVKDPQGHLVSFNRREGGEGSLLSLNRDCLGSQTTEADEHGDVVNKLNEEIISIRGVVPGEYIVNAHAYNMKDSPKPLKVTVKLIKTKPFAITITKEREYSSTGDEQTFFRMVLDKDGGLTESNELPTKFIGELDGQSQEGQRDDQPTQDPDTTTTPEPQP